MSVLEIGHSNVQALPASLTGLWSGYLTEQTKLTPFRVKDADLSQILHTRVVKNSEFNDCNV